MVENTLPSTTNSPQLSVHIMLPESVDRRLERWTNRLAGASWPAWGGHVTLVPPFIETGSPGSVRAALLQVCAGEAPFHLRLGAPLAVPDATRPDYFAVFLTVDSTDADDARTVDRVRRVEEARSGENPPMGEELNAEQDMPSEAERAETEGAVERPSHLYLLRQRLLDALAPLREDVYPQLVEQRFLPHVTLALGLGELEASQLVREIRSDSLTISFRVEVVWLVTRSFGDGARFERDPIPLGHVAPAELMRD